MNQILNSIFKSRTSAVMAMLAFLLAHLPMTVSAQDSTVEDTLIYQSNIGYYINMPVTGVKVLNIPDSVTTFKVYLDKGPGPYDPSYGSVGYSPNCNGYLRMVTSTGKLLRINGQVRTYDHNAYMSIIDGDENSTTKLADDVWSSSTKVVTLHPMVSTGNIATVYFYSNSEVDKARTSLTVKVIRHVETGNLRGSGTIDEPYLISDKNDFQTFANIVAGGNTTICGKLENDVTLDDNMSIGTSEFPYEGTFDGDRHTLTGNYNSTDVSLAPFAYVGNACIKRLNTAGTITSSRIDQSGGGIIGRTIGDYFNSVTLSECQSSMVFQIDHNDNFGGLIGYCGYRNIINDCAFTGRVTSSVMTYFSGFKGEGSGASVISNGLVTAGINIYNLNSSYNRPFTDCYSKLVNCFYLNDCGSRQGTKITADQLTSGETAWTLQGGRSTLVWGQKMGDNADEAPVLTNDESKRLYRVSYRASDNGVLIATQYANASGVGTLPSILIGKTMTIDGVAFTTSTPLTSDTTVTVTAERKPLAVTIADCTVGLGESVKPEITGLPADYDGTITYVSNPSSMVTISNGVLKGAQIGTATITADFAGGASYETYSTTFKVTVKSGITINGTEVTADGGDGWSMTGTELAISGTGNYELSGTQNNGLGVKVASNCTVTLNNLTLAGAYFRIDENCNVSLYLKGSNSLTANQSYYYEAGIRTMSGATLTIDGDADATLTAVAKETAAGIGMNFNKDSNSSIVIKGGIIKATGGGSGAGLGGNGWNSTGTIAISGGTVSAMSTNLPSFIGREIAITGGSVFLPRGYNVHPTNGAVNGNDSVFQVTLEGFDANHHLTFNSGLPSYYNTNDIYTDENGKAYLWLPNGTYNFTVDNISLSATVNSAAVTAEVTTDASRIVTIGSTGYTTFCSSSELDFSGLTDVSAYTVVGYIEDVVYISPMTHTAAGTPLLIKGTPGTYTIPLSLVSSTHANLLKGSTETATTIHDTDGSYANYYLTTDDVGTVGFYRAPSAGIEIPAGKAWLQVPLTAIGKASNAKAAMAAKRFLISEEETTGISGVRVNGQNSRGYVYNLNGQRVSDSTEGLKSGVYIVNGKKVIIK